MKDDLQEDNLFLTLSRYKKPENFLSSALVFLLESLLRCEDKKSRKAACKILSTVSSLQFRVCRSKDIQFRLQRNLTVRGKPESEKGVVDIEISSSGKLVYVEVKDAAKVGKNQLTNYRKALEQEQCKNPDLQTRLVLLTRASTEPEEEQQANIVFWHEVYDSVRGITNEQALKLENPVGEYLIKSFASFLKEKGMAIEKVPEAYVTGLPTVNHLLNMLKSAAVEAQLSSPSSHHDEYFIGYSFQRKKYYLGVCWDEPNTIRFEVDTSKKPMKRGEKALLDHFLKAEDSYDSYAVLKRALNSEFFKFAKKEQLRLISKLVREMYEAVTPRRAGKVSPKG